MPFFGGGGASAGIGGSTGATDNAILRADGTGAATLQNSALVINDEVIAYSATGVASTDIITAVGHNFTANTLVRFLTLTGGSGFFAGAASWYYVVNISGDTFQLANSSGGAAINFTTDITASTIVAAQPHLAIRNNATETNSALVLCNKGTGGFIVSPAIPDGGTTGGNPRGVDSVCIVPARNAADQVAQGAESVCIGRRASATGSGGVAIGSFAFATGNNSVGIGSLNGRGTAISSVGINAIADLRGMFACYPFSSVWWGGTTTNNTATVLNLDASATNRMTIAANTAVMADIFIIARRTDVVGKWFSSRRMVAIRRNNANGTAIIGSVQTIGTDQTEGSPTWSVAITADDTNEALQVEVTGATGETVEWRIMALYRVV